MKSFLKMDTDTQATYLTLVGLAIGLTVALISN